MQRTLWLSSGLLLLTLTGCGGSTEDQVSAGSAAPAATAAVAAPSVDAEYEQLKTVTPVDACALLTPEKLKRVFPDLEFQVHQALKPQLSGYVWDSRCTYWAGVGTIEFAKDVPTHTVDVFVATSVSPEKAARNLASRQEGALSATGYLSQPALGEHAYSSTNTGVASLFFVKASSEVQLNVSNLDAPSEQRLQNILALAEAL